MTIEEGLRSAARWCSKNWLKLLASSLLALLSCLILISFDVLPGIAPEKAEQGKVTYSAPPVESGLRVALEPIPARLLKDDAEISIVFTNQGVSSIKLTNFATTGCLTLLNQSPIGSAIPTIFPRHSVQVTGHVHSLCGPEPSELVMLFSWDEGGSASHYDGFAVTSPITVVGSLRQGALRALKLASAFIHDFSIPVILLVLGVFFNYKQSERAEKLARRETKRAKVLAQRETERANEFAREQDAQAQRQAILQTMLPAYSKLVQEHYLPVTRRIDTVLAESARFFASNAALTDQSSQEDRARVLADEERLLCSVLLMRRRMLLWLLRRGGIYFVAVSGELLYKELSNGFLLICHERMGQDDFDSAVELLDAEDTVNQALNKFRTTDARTRLTERFSAWVEGGTTADATDKFGTCVNLLRMMNELFKFECNRPFYQRDTSDEPSGTGGRHDATASRATTNWYVDAPKLKFEAEMYVIPNQIRENIFRELKAYLEKGIPTKECRGESPYP
jgi:hypothetical protein